MHGRDISASSQDGIHVLTAANNVKHLHVVIYIFHFLVSGIFMSIKHDSKCLQPRKYTEPVGIV